ncbi:MAG: ATP-binding cassette domain-containing protein [Candidatus Latescibacterota bacterium]
MRIAINDVSMVFKNGTRALSHVNLVIENGVFGLIGPNACGKTTLLRILATLLKQTGGMIAYDEYDLDRNRAAIRSMTGYLPQSFSRFTRLKTWEFLDYSASLAGVHHKRTRQNEVDDLLDALGLSGVRDVYANELSVVMKRHLEIAQAVVGNPRILLVDEPTSGLSPEERIRFRNLLSARSEKVEIIIMTSHIFSDISSACGRLAVLNEGEVVFHGAPGDIPDPDTRRDWSIDGLKPGLNNQKTP